MFSLFWSESKKKAVKDEKEFRREGWDAFKREVHRASDEMLEYEVIYYQNVFKNINQAENSASQMKLSGGAPWVQWVKYRSQRELDYVLTELFERRGNTDILEERDGEIRLKSVKEYTDMSYHSWDLIVMCDEYKIEFAQNIRNVWGF